MADAPEIALTSAAAARVAAIAAKQGKPAILRLAVEGGGCAGFSYRFGLADAAEEGDLAADFGAATLVVDEMTHELVKGGVVDFVDNLGGAHFEVKNPNAQSGCGCGSSFSI
ncbi:MAG: iron-sulfur cluster assembly accessory protein [Alphaproteobacteria bacterium]|nr:iron-sulfur cluster assembly accessory protein [Alphaproteobacteria bacterium]